MKEIKKSEILDVGNICKDVFGILEKFLEFFGCFWNFLDVFRIPGIRKNSEFPQSVRSPLAFYIVCRHADGESHLRQGKTRIIRCF